MKKLFLVIAVAGYMSACAPTSNTTSSTGTVNDDKASSDANTDTNSSGTTDRDSDANSGTTGTTGTASDSNTSSSGTTGNTDSNSDMNAADNTSTSQSSTDIPASGTASSSDVMGSSTTITMDQLPKAVRNAYMKLPGHTQATGVKVYQVKTSEHPVLYKIEGTSGSTDYVHYFTPEGTEVQMSDKKY
jgi:hypothetical protein